jgi:hypothetical protein
VWGAVGVEGGRGAVMSESAVRGQGKKEKKKVARKQTQNNKK